MQEDEAVGQPGIEGFCVVGGVLHGVVEYKFINNMPEGFNEVIEESK